MPQQIGEKSKRQQLSEIYRRRYGDAMETPSPKDIKVWEMHKALDDVELRPVTAFVGMYAGYFIFTEVDPIEGNVIYTATKLRRKLHHYNHNGVDHVVGGRNSRWVFGSSEKGIVDSILWRMVDNSGYRGGGTAEITRGQLPAHLRPYLTMPSGWESV